MIVHYPLDVDECSSNPCSQECANVYGSYQCYCRRGYQLSDVDGITCEGKILSCKMGGRLGKLSGELWDKILSELYFGFFVPLS